jgi:hypothetical protein
VAVDGPYACPSKDDLREITRHRTDRIELEMIQDLRAYYLIRGVIVQVVQEDAASGMSEMVDDRGAVRRIAWLEILIREIETLQYEVKDEAAFISSIRDLVANSRGYFPGRSFSFVAPCELPSLHLHAPFQNEWSAFAYRIVLGKTPEDFVLFWNLCAEMGAWKRPYQHFLWLDPDLLQSAGLASALVSWIQLQTDSYGSNRSVELLTRSLSGSQLEQIRETLKTAGCWSIIRVANADNLRMQLNTRWNETRRYRRPLSSLNGNNAHRLVVTNQDDTIYLGETGPSAGEFGNVSWAVDLQIGRHARPGQSHWESFWALPLRQRYSSKSIEKEKLPRRFEPSKRSI